MLAHAIDLADGRARAQQRAGHRLLVRERQPRRRQRQQRRGAARDQAQHEIVRPRGPATIASMRRAAARAGCVGHRMGGLDHLDAAARHAMAVARDDEPDERARPMVLDGARHRGRGLAGADDDGAAARRRRQMRRHDPRRRGGVECGIEEPAQERAVTVAQFHDPSPCRGLCKDARLPLFRQDRMAACAETTRLGAAPAMSLSCLGPGDPPPVPFCRRDGAAQILLTCDHASNLVPRALGDLGLTREELSRHIGWDIGAREVSRGLAERLDAAAVARRLFAARHRLQPRSRRCHVHPGDE